MTKASLPTMSQAPALTALEAMPADLRAALGWRRLFALALDAVLTTAPGIMNQTPVQSPALLTLTTYCYASNLLASEDIEWACHSEADVAYIAGEADITAGDIRQFRRRNRALIEACLQRVFDAALKELPEHGLAGSPTAADMTESLHEFTRRRLNVAVLFDTAFSE